MIRKCSAKDAAKDAATKYANRIVSGKEIACKRERQACQRHLSDLKRQATKEFPYVYDLTRVERIIKFFESYCCHIKGIYVGTPIMLDDWQKFDLSSIFGWVHMRTGVRRFTKSFSEVARGNAKSAIMSGIVLYGATADCVYPPYEPEKKVFESEPEIECTAYDKEQAKIVYNVSRAMAERSPKILSQLKIRETYIKNKRRGGHIRALSKETKNKDGLSTCIAVADELHAWRTSEVMDVILSGFGKRAQNLFCIITTAGNNAENNVAKKEYDICCKILDQIIVDESYFIMIREMDSEAEAYQLDALYKSNPILKSGNEYAGHLLSEIKKARNLALHSGDPAKRREYLTKRCNLWQVGSEDKYFTSEIIEKWRSLAVDKDEFTEITKGQPGVTGLDLSKNIDLTATGVVFLLDDDRIAITAHGFIPEDRAEEHEKTDRIYYKQWAKDDWCTLTTGGVTDDDEIVEFIDQKKREGEWDFEEVGIDPYSSRYIAKKLDEKGYVPIEIAQNMLNLSAATKLLRQMVLQGKIVHDGNPILTWCLSNAIQMTDTNENIKLNKRVKDDTQRIDLAAAVINAMVRLPELERNRSRYEDEGIRSL